jgi:hypothetical protein
LAIAEENFKNGAIKCIPAHYLNDAIENIFSLVTTIVKKPTATSIAQALRIISFKQFQFNPVRGSYEWDNTEPLSIDIIGMLQLFMQNESTANEEKEENENDEFSKEQLKIVKINDEIQPAALFTSPQKDLELNVLFCEASRILSIFINSLSCQSCKNHLIDVHQENQSAAAELFDLRNLIENSSYKNYHSALLRPSSDALTFILRLEYIFREIRKTIAVDDKKFEMSFLESAEQAFLPNEHCFLTKTNLIAHYLKERRHLQLHQYLKHKRLTFASPSLV